jgi:SsrA-binding protein
MATKKKQQDKTPTKSGKPQPALVLIASNKRALMNYEILEKREAGVVLSGSEVKSIRKGSISIREAYARFLQDGLFLVNAHIAPYQPQQKLLQPYVPTRSRKLLLHQSEIKKLQSKTQEKGLTLLPLEVYIKNNRIKVLLGLGRGRKQYEKKDYIKEREDGRRLQRAFKV